MICTCENCPFWEATSREGYEDRGVCHHAANDNQDGDPVRRKTWWCSEHPFLQRDRVALVALQGILASLPTSSLEQAHKPFGPFAAILTTQAYEFADAVMAGRVRRFLNPPQP